ncbi:MAG: hypothetical protein Q8N47_08795 [Bryobacterales bacterium]|nr:hypothetical protein [Bryobacterales bacterium]
MKALLGFAAGALVAASVAWFVVSRNKPAEPAPVVQAALAPAPVAAEPAPAPAPAPAAITPSKPAPVRRPSPAVAANRAPEPQPAAAPSAPAPQPEPARSAPSAPVAPPPQPPPPPQPRTVTLSAGTLLPVRLGETLTSEKNKEGDAFAATLDKALVIDGAVVAERGARLDGRVVEADRAGKVRGVAHLAIELVRLTTADGQRITLRTEAFHKDGQAERGRDAAKIGAGAAIGAAIGAIAGGGRGAAIGAGVGGAAGTGAVLTTRGKPAELPVETRISFRVNEAVTITETLR